jgi:hypothetical protein
MKLAERTVPNDTEDYFPKRFGLICGGSLGLLLPDHLVAAGAGESACDGTATVDLGVDSFAGSAVYDQRALRIHGPFPGAYAKGRVPRATPPAIVSGPGWPFRTHSALLPASIVPSKVRDTPT